MAPVLADSRLTKHMPRILEVDEASGLWMHMELIEGANT